MSLMISLNIWPSGKRGENDSALTHAVTTPDQEAGNFYRPVKVCFHPLGQECVKPPAVTTPPPPTPEPNAASWPRSHYDDGIISGLEEGVRHDASVHQSPATEL